MTYQFDGKIFDTISIFHFKVWKILIWKKKRVEKSQLIGMTRKIMSKSSFFVVFLYVISFLKFEMQAK